MCGIASNRANAQAKAELAFDVHKALMLAEHQNPSLAQNGLWLVAKADAYEQFLRAYEEAGR